MSDPFELTDEPEIAPPGTVNPPAEAPGAPVSYLQGLNEPQIEAVQAIDGPFSSWPVLAPVKPGF